MFSFGMTSLKRNYWLQICNEGKKLQPGIRIDEVVIEARFFFKYKISFVVIKGLLIFSKYLWI